MTNIKTIEDVLESILGLVLGGTPGQHTLATSGSGGGQSGGKSSVNDAFRPPNIKGPWLIAQSSTLEHFGGWAPEYNKDAVTFYKWTQAGAKKKITRVTVWVGVTNRDNAQGQTRNTTDPTKTVKPTENPVIVLGSAWETIHKEIPLVAGVGTSFDPNSIAAVRQILGVLTHHAMKISGQLTDQMNSVNVKNPEFKGSAESAWYHRVQSANRHVSDIHDQFKRWDSVLYQVETETKSFIKALLEANANWSKITPAGTWQHPYRVIAAMFNQSTLQYADVHNGQSNAWDLGSQYANTGNTAGNDSSNPRQSRSGKDVGTVLWTPPKWLEYPAFDAFNLTEWNKLDLHLRQRWVTNLIGTFAPVLTSAKTMVTAFSDARNPMYLADPDPVPPLPMPNDIGPDGHPNWDKMVPDWDKMFANWDKIDWDNMFPNWGGVDWDKMFPNGGNTFGYDGIDDPFANGPGGGSSVYGGLDDPFANGPGGGFAFTTSGNPFANGPGGGSSVYGGLDDPFANGPGGGSAFTTSSNPFANLGPGFSMQPGGNFVDPQELGDLTPDQLRQLHSDGLLDDVPLTAEQTAYLRENGLSVPDGTTMLGQLTPKQLAALHRAGLLDDIPLTEAARSHLGLVDPSSQSGGATSVPGLDPSKLPWYYTSPKPPVDINPFPTTVDGLEVSPKPGKGSTGGLPTFGDVTIPGVATFPSLPGVQVGTGGLSSVPGISGSAGVLSQDKLGLPVGGPGGAGAATGATGTGTTQTTGDNSLGGMPYMPGMLGGAPGMYGGGGHRSGQDRDRQRTTWLKEDEKVWGTDPDCAPAVVGRRGRKTRSDDDGYDDYDKPVDERTGTQDERRPYWGR
ncbi:hypothetical protein GCM10027280_06650 [Micromonospora polyrhachis]|uniref:Uncharacterized protein n=1 Tax=Micromonospora polyrhachis TaxID=1282883 RepID=A0A7W7SKK6_9ACTN|nr:glycine rich domain-containing protein [Micromonospora polyrhachis]MBB4956424.1 hypothetical protein [Micromonospora polyrhachis]